MGCCSSEEVSIAHRINQSKTKSRYVFLVRHGEKADRHGDSADRGNIDSQLTQTGKQQAIETGWFIHQTLEQIEDIEGKRFGQIKVSSSPFVRCMLTASKICSVLNVSAFELNYNYCELLLQSRYPE